MKQIVAVDVERPGKANWQTVIPEAASALVHADIIGERFVVEYLEDAKSVVRFFSMEGEPMGILDLPGAGAVSFGPSGGFSGRPAGQ
jgi:prolyl oligopeptidase